MEQLITTKLFVPPTRPGLIHRPRLIDRLNACAYLGCKLSLISAPAGFGKTTLVSEWVQTMDKAAPSIAIAWISLDDGDNDPARFLAYFIAAINQAQGGEAAIGIGSLSMLQSPQPPPTEVVLTPLVNEVANIPDRYILVLDDYHVIESSQVDDALSFMLEYLPPQMHLVIATREDPHLPLPRLRARGQMTELRAADLRFTSTEGIAEIQELIDVNNREQLGLILLSKTEMLSKIIEDGLADTTKPKDRLAIYLKLNELVERLPETLHIESQISKDAHEFLKRGPELVKARSRLVATERTITIEADG